MKPSEMSLQDLIAVVKRVNFEINELGVTQIANCHCKCGDCLGPRKDWQNVDDSKLPPDMTFCAYKLLLVKQELKHRLFGATQ